MEAVAEMEEEMVIKNIVVITLFALLFVACSSKKVTINNENQIENRYLNEYANIKTSYTSNIKSKWIQPNNKEESCKVYVEYDEKKDRTKSSLFKIFWDGECENGYAKGLGKEFEKGILTNNQTLAIYENPPFKKPKYYTQNFQLKDIKVFGDLNSGFSVYKIEKNHDEKYRYGFFSKDYKPTLLTYDSNNNKDIIYKKIYPNFNYEIIYNKDTKEYQFFLNGKNSRYKINNMAKRNEILQEILNAKEYALKKQSEAKLVEKQYKNKTCKDYISVNFLGDDEYKSICDNQKVRVVKNEISKNKEDFEDELEYLLDSSKSVEKNENAYAIVFGIEDYLLESNVNYSQNSAKMFIKYAKKLLGVPEDNIWAFVEDRETSAGFIKSEWGQFLSSIPKDATIYFYYSGHGVPGMDGNPYILPSDTNAETVIQDKSFMLNTIYKNLTDTKANKVVAFVDSCFSGKDDNGNLLFGGVAPVLRTNPAKFNENKMILFTAGSSNEFSNQYKRKKHRLFSYFLMKGLARGYDNSIDLYEYLKKNVSNKSRKMGFAYKQTPQLSGLTNSHIR